MPRAQKLDDVACAICMDSLFTKRDDLDDVIPISTPDCGHVFHEECLLEWFKSQQAQYIAYARDHGLQDRERSPSFSEAPAECPTCRTECFADPETGEPSIHRLYINFNDTDCVGSSSQVGSSPLKRSVGARGKVKEEEMVLGFARRAKGLVEEGRILGGHSDENDMEGMLGRAERLKEDLVSAKAIQGVKTYVGGLTAAINHIRTTLETHPLIPNLNAEVAQLRRANLAANNDLLLYMNHRMPREVATAVQAEQVKWEKKIQKVRDEGDLIKRELEKEKVQRRSARKAMEEKEVEVEKKMFEMKRLLKEEQEERQSLQTTLTERTKMIRVWQSKAESRKTLQAQIDKLEAENLRLIDTPARSATVQPTVAGTTTTRQGDTLDDLFNTDPVDLSIEEIPASAFRSKRPRPSYPAPDESLSIDMDTSMTGSMLPPTTQAPPSHIAGPSKPRGTARTYSFELDTPDTESKKINLVSKYFAMPPPPRDKGIIIPSSSPPRPPSPISRPRPQKTANPFVTTREASSGKKTLKPEIIDLVSDSPDRRVLRTVDGNGNGNGKRSLVDVLGMTDAQGRPKKGLANGLKAKRRA